MRPRSALTVDVIVVDDTGQVLLVRRKNDPFRGFWALPGGFVEYGERVEDAAVREIVEETGIEVDLTDIMGVYSSPDRDPRGHTVTVVFVGRPLATHPQAGDDAAAVSWFTPTRLLSEHLAFDHAQVIADFVRWSEHRGTYWSSRQRV
ncbi:MAG: NUDIX hydrolase [Candidatus Thorarchaeota archaeon]